MADTKTLAEALVELQKDLPEVTREATGQAGPRTYKYADLKSVSDAILPKLTAVGLAYTAAVKILDTQAVVLRCTLHHVSGQTLDSDFPITQTGQPQQIGAAITYGRRYCLGALTGLATEEDTDGQFGDEQSGKVKRTRGKAKPDQWSTPPPADEPPAGEPPPFGRTGPATIPPLTEGQMKGIHAGFAEIGVTDDQKHATLSKILGREVASSKDLDRRDAALVLDAINNRKAQLARGEQ